ncbi:MAG: hypothetical protein ACKVG6_04020 [Alphaproteobacteria bacterium]|jgi:hypothetical protein
MLISTDSSRVYIKNNSSAVELFSGMARRDALNFERRRGQEPARLV